MEPAHAVEFMDGLVLVQPDGLSGALRLPVCCRYDWQSPAGYPAGQRAGQSDAPAGRRQGADDPGGESD